MPYIVPTQRAILDPSITALNAGIRTAGDLTYTITKLLAGFWKGEENYLALSEIIGTLECIKQEFYRRKVAPYEDKKKKENGDVF